jgi:DNA-binding NtrC family response regulator
MLMVKRMGERAAKSSIPILITGESGVGKEVIARAVHGSSERAGKPFVAVNCGAIPENLVESILFGHEKGSFTGATDKHLGKFQEANGGTLFLDEVGELPLDMQVKLLRALQESEIDPGRLQALGQGRRAHRLGHQPRPVAGGRRGPVPRGPVLPAQRLPDRGAGAARAPEDIPPLVDAFVRRFNVEEGKSVVGASPRRWPA